MTLMPNWVTAPIILNFEPIIFFKTILATAPAATLQAVSLADCLPPPLKSLIPYFLKYV